MSRDAAAVFPDGATGNINGRSCREGRRDPRNSPHPPPPLPPAGVLPSKTGNRVSAAKEIEIHKVRAASEEEEEEGEEEEEEVIAGRGRESDLAAALQFPIRQLVISLSRAREISCISGGGGEGRVWNVRGMPRTNIDASVSPPPIPSRGSPSRESAVPRYAPPSPPSPSPPPPETKKGDERRARCSATMPVPRGYDRIKYDAIWSAR